MLDSTTCDIYIVNESGGIVGRPILTLCVDAYSGLVCGYSLSWEGGVYSLRNLMLNVISGKVEHCKSFGISITEEQWPCKQLPLKLVTDQGSEYKGETFSQIVDLGVEVLNLKSFRADEKGPVEQAFNAIQNYFKPVLKGKGVIEVDFQERGARDYRKDACLTLADFEKVILNCIIFYNSNRVLEHFPFTEDMLNAEVKPIPCHVWKWGCEQLGANLMEVSKAYLKEHLPAYKVVDIREKSAYPEDAHLYMVSAQKDDGTFAVWTCWNQETKSLNHGHYNLPHHDDCVEIFEEYYTPKEE